MVLRPLFPDGKFWFFSVFVDLCNDLNFILIFILGYALTVADDQGMGEVIKKSRWYNLTTGITRIQSSSVSFSLRKSTGSLLPFPLLHPWRGRHLRPAVPQRFCGVDLPDWSVRSDQGTGPNQPLLDSKTQESYQKVSRNTVCITQCCYSQEVSDILHY